MPGAVRRKASRGVGVLNSYNICPKRLDKAEILVLKTMIRITTGLAKDIEECTCILEKRQSSHKYQIIVANWMNL